MIAYISLFLGAGLAASIGASGLQARNATTSNNKTLVAYSIPEDDLLSVTRGADIETKRTTFTYGPPIENAGPYSPAGALGTALIAADAAIITAELLAEDVLVQNDTLSENIAHNGTTLRTLQDYVNLYDGQWQASSKPTGIDPGMLTNYTQDLLFSMERLSFSPYAVRRLNPVNETAPFEVDDDLAQQITGQTVDTLLKAGRLFYADHRDQASLERTPDKYAPACDALFYISNITEQFLPLAIRPNVNNTLTYTPLDKPNDWLLAKIMFNVNDFFFAQFHHLANTHYVVEIVYESAVRTLSDQHPVLAILSRLLYGEFGIRPLAEVVLIAKGGRVDQYFGYTGAAAGNLTNQLYFNGYAGAVQSNYFEENLRRRGLLDAPVGPALKHFPFYEDALAIHQTIEAFVTSFVQSYYTSDSDLTADNEIQAWVSEAQGPAETIDFPALTTREALIDLLTHVGHLVSAAHHAVNTNELITGSTVLPFHPPGLYQPIPTTKNVADVVPFLPPYDKAVGFLQVSGDFARPLLAGTARSLVHMFDDPVMLARMNAATRAANTQFVTDMKARSAVVKARGFDSDGLSQGMPFVWKQLNPDVAPWSTTV